MYKSLFNVFEALSHTPFGTLIPMRFVLFLKDKAK